MQGRRRRAAAQDRGAAQSLPREVGAARVGRGSADLRGQCAPESHALDRVSQALTGLAPDGELSVEWDEKSPKKASI